MDPVFTRLLPGDPAPRFVGATTTMSRFTFDTAGGRYIVLCLLGTAGDVGGQVALRAIAERHHIFDDEKFCLFGVVIDPEDQAQNRVQERLPGIRFFLDYDLEISRRYGALARDAAQGQAVTYRRSWIVLDPALRVLQIFPISGSAFDHAALFDYLSTLPAVDSYPGFSVQAPVLCLHSVFEPALCQKLISLYERHGGGESGFMREINGKTVGVYDHNHKRRKDHNIIDEEIIRITQARITRRIVPEIARVYQFHVTRMERYIVSCYAAEDGGHFRAHRDDTTKGTAHRRFAVSINLNGEFEGGEISFPEFGPRGFKPPPGGAVIFSCSLLHKVSKVTAGRRYAFLPFLYDEAAAKIRAENLGFIDQPAAG
ncbi:MAG: 2OG-Fe(II) oxygenase [Roseomonas sp.]|nr:2OG-Fe(II) oxygenase [Roseomonas sp.]